MCIFRCATVENSFSLSNQNHCSSTEEDETTRVTIGLYKNLTNEVGPDVCVLQFSSLFPFPSLWVNRSNLLSPAFVVVSLPLLGQRRKPLTEGIFSWGRDFEMLTNWVIDQGALDIRAIVVTMSCGGWYDVCNRPTVF